MEQNRTKITVLNIASTVILQGLAFFSGPIFSGLLGTENYGIAAVYLTWVQLASTTFSLQAGSTVALAKVYFPENEQKSYQSSVLSLATILYCGFSILTILCSLIVAKWVDINIPMLLVGLLHGWGFYVVGFMNNKFTYEFKAKQNLILSITVSTLAIGVSILLIRFYPIDTNYWGRIIGQAAVYFFLGMILFFRILHSGKSIINLKYWKFTLPIAIPTVFHLLALILLNQSDKVMLQRMIGNSAAGIYALAATFGAVINALWSAFNNSWVPFFYEYLKHNQIDEMKKHAQNYIELFTIITIGFILLSREVFHLYAESDFWSGTDLIPLFSLGFYFNFLYSFPVNYEFYNKKTKTIAIGTTLAALCNIVFNFVLINMWGIMGAVIATAMAHALQFFFHYLSAKKIDQGKFPFKIVEFLPGLFMVCLFCIVYILTKDLWILRWIIGILLGAYLLIKIIKRKEIF